VIFESKINPETPKMNPQTHLQNPESRHKSDVQFDC